MLLMEFSKPFFLTALFLPTLFFTPAAIIFLGVGALAVAAVSVVHIMIRTMPALKVAFCLPLCV